MVIRIYKENHAGDWEHRELPAVYGEGLAIADFDRDGDIDIAIPAKWYENPGDIIKGDWKEHFVDLTINQVAQMNRAISVWQGTGYQEIS